MTTLKSMHLFTKMKTLCIFPCLLLSACVTKSQELTSYVDPTIGSRRTWTCMVGAGVPFGAVQVGPDNIFKGWDWCSGYHYSDSLIIGFAQTHLSGTGIGVKGLISFKNFPGDDD